MTGFPPFPFALTPSPPLPLPTPSVKRQVRCAHLDTPDFGAYKRPTQEKDSREADYSRRAFTYLLGAGSAVAGAHLAKSVVQDFLDTMSASVRLHLWAEAGV